MSASPNRTTPVRRVTIFCRDAEASLALYRDILGFSVIEDKTIEGPAMARLMGLEDCRVRILYLRSGSGPDGLLALFAIEKGQDEEVPRVAPMPVKLGQVAVVFYTDDVAALETAIRKAGHPVLLPTQRYVKAKADTYTQAGEFYEMMFTDPDGVMVNLVQFTPAAA